MKYALMVLSWYIQAKETFSNKHMNEDARQKFSLNVTQLDDLKFIISRLPKLYVLPVGSQ